MTNTSEDADRPAERDRDGPIDPDAQSRPPGGEIPKPKADAARLKLEKAEKDWLDYAVGFFAFVASVGAIGAAVVASYQGWVARDTEKRQLRAYVFLESVHVTDTKDKITGDDPNRGLSATIIFKNFGQTPAYNVWHLSSLKVADFPAPSTVFVRDPAKRPIPMDTLGPQGGTQSVVQPSEPDSASGAEGKQQLGSQSRAIYVFGKIDYEDAFGVKRCTRYRFMVGGNAGLRGSDALRVDTGNMLRMDAVSMQRMETGNEADKDCEKPD
jgi:hypothetical protein